MAELTLDVARKILDAALAKGIEKKLKPLVVTVLDVRGCVKVTAAQDGTSLMRNEIAHGKAYAEGLGQCQPLHVIPGAGHALLLEEPEAVAAILTRFLTAK
jgi:uncharacterized protein GlcG (DUF336 family)